MREHFADNEKTHKSFNLRRCQGICKIKTDILLDIRFTNSGDVLLSQAAGTLSQQFGELLVV